MTKQLLPHRTVVRRIFFHFALEGLIAAGTNLGGYFLANVPHRSRIFGKRRVFSQALLSEIEQTSIETFRSLTCIRSKDTNESIPSRFVLDQISVPSYAAMSRIEEDYEQSKRTVDALAEQLNIDPKEAHKKTIMSFVKKDGIDVTVAIPLRDLAVELLPAAV